MKFRIDHHDLAEAVGWAARTLPARPALPVLAGMLIEATPDGVTLAGFDYEVSARAAAEAAVSEPGRVLVPGRLLAEIVRSLPAQPVEIFTEGAEAVVRCGSVEFGLLTMPVEDYPTLPEPPASAGTVPGEAFATAIAQVVVAASRDDTLPMLTGVRVDIEGEVIRLACTDRYRIASCELRWSPVSAGFSAAAVVPARTLADVARSLRAGTEVALSLTGAGDSLLGISAAGRSMTTRLLDDQFIDYRARLVGEWTSVAEVATAPFVEAIKRVALVADRNVPVRLAFTQGSVRIRAASGDAARANETLSADLDGDEVDIGFNPQFLLDGLAGITSMTTRLHCNGPTKAALLTPGPAQDDEADVEQDDAYRYLLMPIRLAG
ncbi:DNA polymerase-3 subunit beta [Thermomonospora echinospora]|uniref:Beta sliding clamp n=1 Tax=Thermomonospora echinospora TaxID=1992 RepID=A0A1H6DBT3_9ACTN|nr:DNA polymerase III subunit beta [Thermomonospora echinospora]SEG82917.1 DNA polymerase-3 subunit beta [Thermomonospora echinospora]